MNELHVKITLGFLFLLLFAISIVSFHYRRRYEDLEEFIRLMKEENKLKGGYKIE